MVRKAINYELPSEIQILLWYDLPYKSEVPLMSNALSFATFVGLFVCKT